MNGNGMPAEWEEQSMVMITWPHADTDWRDCLSEINATYAMLASAISSRERLLIVSPRPYSCPLRTERIMFHACPTNDTWARDHGFISVRANGEMHLLDFRFNGWGGKYPAELDNAINRSVYGSGAVKGFYENHDDFVLEGGSVESDGRGTVMTTASCLMAPGRNQPLSREQIEAELCRRLRAERIVWINNGRLAGDDTDGHIDTLVRFAPNDTLLYVATDDENDEHYDCLRRMEDELRTLRTIEGRPYRLVRLPLPEAIYEDGERLPATYANFLVINGAVIIPTYGQPTNDRRAIEAISAAFPGREPIAIDSRVIIRQHGSIHCCTMQMFEK